MPAWLHNYLLCFKIGSLMEELQEFPSLSDWSTSTATKHHKCILLRITGKKDNFHMTASPIDWHDMRKRRLWTLLMFPLTLSEYKSQNKSKNTLFFHYKISQLPFFLVQYIELYLAYFPCKVFCKCTSESFQSKLIYRKSAFMTVLWIKRRHKKYSLSVPSSWRPLVWQSMFWKIVQNPHGDIKPISFCKLIWTQIKENCFLIYLKDLAKCICEVVKLVSPKPLSLLLLFFRIPK